MGCHTWFSVPVKTDKQEILKIAQDWLNREFKNLENHDIQHFQDALNLEDEDVVCEMASEILNAGTWNNWIIYKDVTQYSIDKWNSENEIKVERYKYETWNDSIECYSDEPRIGGYPENIIHSYEEMLEFMKTGFVKNGKQIDFYYDVERYDNFMGGIKTFFEKHSDGIIYFG